MRLLHKEEKMLSSHPNTVIVVLRRCEPASQHQLAVITSPSPLNRIAYLENGRGWQLYHFSALSNSFQRLQLKSLWQLLKAIA
jgi:hypothetical protein